MVRSDREELYVADQNSDAIHVFDTSGNTLRTFSGSGLDDSGAAEHPPNGAVFDFDADLDVDHPDFAGLQRLVIAP